MTPATAAPGGETRQALAVGIACYLIWGLTPVLFIVMNRVGAGPLDILGQRAVWSAPWAAGLVLISGRGREFAAVLRRPKVLGLLAVSAVLITINWSVFVWAVSQKRNLETSLGYFINPLLNMALGGLLFRERINRTGLIAIGLAAIGVVIQTAALGRPPLISLTLAASFCGYGLIRRQVDASAQVGLLVECALIAIPGLFVVNWMAGHGGGVEATGVGGRLLMATTGPATVIPLAMFSWAARRLPFSTLGFIQFVVPTMGFGLGLIMGERLSALGLVSFAFIWAGVAVFILGLARAGRRLQPSAA